MGAEADDPRRWFTLAIVITAVLIVVLDNTVLNVAIPTILRDFHTTLPSLQWVVTGYALTFATLLIIGGRLADLYGARRTFMVGAALFGAGSLLASLSTSVPVLILGEALIEGIGASLMLPATLGILSRTFRGRERAAAFAAWGAVAGAAVAFGPILGGYLTTYHSWRWAFRINVIVTPLAILGALVFMGRDARAERRERLDVPGALLVAAGMFCLVFGLSEGGTYGWSSPIKTLVVLHHHVWPASRPVSLIPLAFVAAAVLLSAFYVLERRKEREDRSPLFEFGQLRHRGFRYGLLTAMVLAMGQLGVLFVLPVFLQDGKHLSAVDNGLWMVPLGAFIVVGAQVGGRLTRRLGVTGVVRAGLVIDSVGLVYIALSVSPHITLLSVLPGFALFGLGVGFATSQLTNVILFDIDPDKSGAASGANATVRQVGSALGVAVIGSILSTQTIHHGIARVQAAALPAADKARALSQIRARGLNFTAAPGRSAAVLGRTLEGAVAAAARPALVLAAAIVVAGTALSMLIPTIAIPEGAVPPDEAVEGLEPVDPDPTVTVVDVRSA